MSHTDYQLAFAPSLILFNFSTPAVVLTVTRLWLRHNPQFLARLQSWALSERVPHSPRIVTAQLLFDFVIRCDMSVLEDGTEYQRCL